MKTENELKRETLLSALKTAQALLKAQDIYDRVIWETIAEAEKVQP